MFVFKKCNRASQDIDIFFILKQMIPSQAILDCHKKYLSLHLRYLEKIWFAKDLLKAVTSTDRKPDVVFSRCGRHLEKWI